MVINIVYLGYTTLKYTLVGSCGLIVRESDL